MAGEMIKTEAVCLGIYPWSRTSHIVSWLTPHGKVRTMVKGAARAKSFFLGQYDLNYTCEIVYYARAKGELHALRECTPLKLRDHLRGDWRRLALAEYMRKVTAELTPHGREAEEWKELLESCLDAEGDGNPVAEMLEFEISALNLAGVSPDFTGCKAPSSMFYIEEGAFSGQSSRQMPVTPMVAACLLRPRKEKNLNILLDAARVIGVYYTFHLDFPPDARRTVLKIISKEQEEKHEENDCRSGAGGSGAGRMQP